MAMFQIYALDEQIKALPTVDTASGAIATFDTDLTENLVDVKCQIVAKQASGTPSPVNPLPITTYTEMNVSATGKNLLNNSDKTITIGAYIINNVNVYMPAGYYVLSFNFSGTSNSSSLRIDDENGTAIFTTTKIVISGHNEYLINLPSKGSFVKLYSNAIGTYSKFQIELGNQFTAFEAYNGTTSNIPFGQTVSNGVLDVTTGKLTITHGVADMGTLPWELAATSTGHWWFRANVPNVAKAGGNSVIPDIKCEVYQTITPNNAYTGNMGITSNASTDNYLHATDENYSDATSFTGAVNGKKVVYKLVNPVIVQLDSITLQALLNENNIWCDTGDTEVKFILSVGKKIQ